MCELSHGHARDNRNEIDGTALCKYLQSGGVKRLKRLQGMSQRRNT